jgi:hypothetical protein
MSQAGLKMSRPVCYATGEKMRLCTDLPRSTVAGEFFRRNSINTLLHLLLPLLLATWTQVATAADTRQVYTSDSPTWLRAVGKLQVPGSKFRDGQRSHHWEDCSATLVTGRAGRRADTIVTAWHCLEFYNDLSKPIVFTLLPGSQQRISSEVYRVADGGSMHADWAILKLHQAVPAELVTAILIHPQRADARRPISMAGYSRDSGVGNNGLHLTFDGACHITSQAGEVSGSNCTAHKGASGGAVVQLSAGGEPWLSGVISQGDSDTLSIYVPVARFRSAISRFLR